MTDREFKRLTRAQLMDIIYQLQLQVDALEGEKLQLQKALDDKRLRMDNAGNIAEAALEISECFRSAQDAADQYLDEIRQLREETQQQKEQILEEARQQQEKILEEARAEAAESLADATRPKNDLERAVAAILQEYGHSDW